MFVHDVDCATKNEINILAIFIRDLNIRDFGIFDKLKIEVEVILWVLHTKVLESWQIYDLAQKLLIKTLEDVHKNFV